MGKPQATRHGGVRKVWWIAGLLALVLTAALFAYREPIQGYAAAGTAYGARVACSCRFVAGRSVEDCAKDKVPGMELIRLSEDEAARSVTASFPLVRSDTARLREGYGCVMQPWNE
jgi:hypothetical protein